MEGRKGNLSAENKRTLAALIQENQERSKGVAPDKAGLKGRVCTKLFIQGISKNTTVCFY